VFILQAGVVVLCGASSLATSLAHVYSKQQLTIVPHQQTPLHAWTGMFQHSEGVL
jgi:hypothetical protein